jgi:2,4-dienoyl-CoA reductase (NADPH2)
VEFIKLFEPITINQLPIKNRIVMPAIGLNYTQDYTLTERLKNFYRTRARGGVGLMIIGPVGIDKVGSVSSFTALFDDQYVEPFKNLVDELHRETDAKIGIQLLQMGRNAISFLTGLQAISPSALYNRLTKEYSREMTKDDIEEVKESYAKAAIRANQVGFDYIEILGCTGYLISQFLSPVTNLRTDEYGGSIENRMRFPLEVIQKARESIGKDMALGVRVAGNDFIEGGHTNDQSAIFCAEAQKAGIDAINVTGGWHDTNVPQLTSHVPQGAYVYLARGIKEKVDIPVFASNRLGDPAIAEKALRSGAADMICWARPLIADPELPRKVKEKRFNEIITCISCNQGCFDNVFVGAHVTCTVNPIVSREGKISIEKTPDRKKIAVAGGGPAGMQFALTAAQRGHNVTLFEKEDHLGGQVELAAAPPGKKEFLNITKSLENRLRHAGIKVNLKTSLTPVKIKKIAPDVLVVATGARSVHLQLPGIDKSHVVDAWDVLKGNIPNIGKQVVVVGGNAVGCETAEFIASEGVVDSETMAFLMFHAAEDSAWLKSRLCSNARKVTVIEIADRLGSNVGASTRWTLMKDVNLRGIKLLPRTKLVEITNHAIIVETPEGRKTIPADTVVMAVGSKAIDNLAKKIASNGIKVITIGDAKTPRRFIEAIKEGFEEALKI